MSETTEYAGVGTASLSTSVNSVDGDDPFTIHGVALGSGDITLGQSGNRKYWPAETLEQAAASLEGQPLVKDHVNNSDGHVGTVTQARFEPGVGVRYQAEIAPHYEELARDVAAGIKDVSPRIKHPPKEHLDEYDEATLEVTNARFDNLAVVNKGASPSNTAEFGPDPSFNASQAVAMSAFDNGEMATATLERGSASLEHGVGAGDTVKWSTDESSGKGKVESVEDGMATIIAYEDGDRGLVEAGTETIPVESLESWSTNAELGVDEDEETSEELESEETEETDETSEELDASESEEVDVSESEESEELEDEEAEIDLAENIVSGLENKAQSHNESHEEEWQMVGLDQLKSVYRRGAGAYTESVAGDMTRQAWSMARVDAFLNLVSSGDPEDTEYTQDNDLLPAGHPKATASDDTTSEDEGEEEASAYTPDPERLEELAVSYSDSPTGQAEQGSMSPDSGDMYDTKEAAESRAGDLGCEGAHEHEVDGETKWMPCSSMQSYNDASGEEASAVTKVADGEANSTPCRGAGEATLAATESLTVATVVSARPSRSAETVASQTTMNEITYEDADEEDVESLSDGVIVEREELEALRDEADRADNVDAELSELREELGAFSEAKDTLSEVEEDAVEELAEIEDPVVMPAEEVEELNELVDETAGIYAEELAKYSAFEAEELSDRFEPSELRAKVEDHDEAELSATLAESDPEPSAGSASTEELSEAEQEADEDEPDVEELEEEAAKEYIAEELEDAGWNSQAQKVRDGDIPVDSFDISVEAE